MLTSSHLHRFIPLPWIPTSRSTSRTCSCANLAENIPPEKFHELGLGLGLTVTDLSAINQETADPVTKTFRILDRWRSNLDPFLIRWRNKVDGKETERLKLETALRQSGLDMFIPCIGKGAKTCLYIISNSTKKFFFFSYWFEIYPSKSDGD